MTTVIVYKNSSNYKGFVCMGHAGYAKKRWFGGHEPDILCASVSTLVINTLNSMEEFTGEAENMSLTTNEETGFIKCDFKDSLNEKSVLLLDAMIFGLQKLSEEYGTEYLQVKFEEV